MITIIQSGDKQALILSRKISKMSNIAIRRAFQRIGVDLKESASKGMLKHPKHGRLYRLKLHDRMVNHRASSPDEDPANFSGALRKSLGYTVNGTNQMSFGAGGGPVEYARILEIGGKVQKGNKLYTIEPRNYLKRAIQTRQGNIRQYFEQEIKGAIK